MLSLNDRFFTKEVVKTFFDLRIRVKYNILRLKNLEYYIGKEKAKRYLSELEEFEKDVEEYMEIYNERFNISAIKRHLERSRLENEKLIKKYQIEIDLVRKFKENNDFPIGTYSLEINLFVEDYFEDILKLEKYKREQEKVIINSI